MRVKAGLSLEVISALCYNPYEVFGYSKHSNTETSLEITGVNSGTAFQSLSRQLRDNFFVLILLAAASLLAGGIGIGLGNHSVQIPVVRHIVDPTLYSYGSYSEFLSSYYSLYWKAVAFWSQYFGLTPVLIVIHVLTRIVLFTGIFSLGYSLFRSRAAALMAVGLSVFELRTILVTAATITDRIPTHTIFAMALSVWALFFLWQRKLIICSIILGIICQVNLMNGLLVVAVFGVVVVFNIKSFWSWSLPAAFLLWLLISYTPLLWAIRAPGPDVDMVEYTQALRSFFDYHMFPLTWGAKIWIRLGGLLAVVFLCVITRGAVPQRGMIYATLLGIGLTWFIAIAVSVAEPLKPLVRLQWCRTCFLLVLLILPIVSYVILRILPNLSLTKLFIYCSILIGGWTVAHGYSAGLVMGSVCGWSVVLYYYKLKGRTVQQQMIYSVAFVLALAVSTATGYVYVKSVLDNGFRIQTQPERWVEAQLWAKDNTAKDAVFLTPPNQTGFRVFSERSVYFTRKNRGAILVCQHHTAEVLEKYKELVSLNFWREPLENVNWGGIRRLCKSRGIDYIVLPSDIKLQLKSVYSNAEWVIYDAGPWR